MVQLFVVECVIALTLLEPCNNNALLVAFFWAYLFHTLSQQEELLIFLYLLTYLRFVNLATYNSLFPFFYPLIFSPCMLVRPLKPIVHVLNLPFRPRNFPQIWKMAIIILLLRLEHLFEQ